MKEDFYKEAKNSSTLDVLKEILWTKGECHEFYFTPILMKRFAHFLHGRLYNS